MILEKLSLCLPAEKLMQIAPGAETHKPRKKDYWPEQWKQMQHFTGANLCETISGKNLFYQLGFMQGKMVSVQINSTAEMTETGYAALRAISDEIIAANAVRQFKIEREPSQPMPWAELKDQRLAESGLPNDRYLICRDGSWGDGKIHSYLNIALGWPHVLSLEYREETRET